MTSILKKISYTQSRMQTTSQSMPSRHHRPIGIMQGELMLKLKYQKPHYKGNQLPIHNRTHRTEFIAKNVKDIVKRLYAVRWSISVLSQTRYIGIWYKRNPNGKVNGKAHWFSIETESKKEKTERNCNRNVKLETYIWMATGQTAHVATPGTLVQVLSFTSFALFLFLFTFCLDRKSMGFSIDFSIQILSAPNTNISSLWKHRDNSFHSI